MIYLGRPRNLNYVSVIHAVSFIILAKPGEFTVEFYDAGAAAAIPIDDLTGNAIIVFIAAVNNQGQGDNDHPGKSLHDNGLCN
jgi:hypothetical protein